MIKVLILFGIAVLGIYGIAVLIGSLLPASFGQQSKVSEENADGFIYLINNGYHVEICLPAAGSSEELTTEIHKIAPEAFSQKEPEYFCFGWGDRTFYPGTPFLRDLNIVSASKALLLPTQAAMRISWYYNPLRETSTVKKIPVTNTQIDKLYRFVSASYMYDSRADIKLLPIPESQIDPAFD
ncbi:MAG: DUF2459 domain-containing protein, partial [Spirochaetales bacterium]|nr:DUF2459 domain-containing protein [Spirochaetales bacterium]